MVGLTVLYAPNFQHKIKELTNETYVHDEQSYYQQKKTTTLTSPLSPKDGERPTKRQRLASNDDGAVRELLKDNDNNNEAAFLQNKRESLIAAGCLVNEPTDFDCASHKRPGLLLKTKLQRIVDAIEPSIGFTNPSIDEYVSLPHSQLKWILLSSPTMQPETANGVILECALESSVFPWENTKFETGSFQPIELASFLLRAHKRQQEDDRAKQRNLVSVALLSDDQLLLLLDDLQHYVLQKTMCYPTEKELATLHALSRDFLIRKVISTYHDIERTSSVKELVNELEDSLRSLVFLALQRQGSVL